MPNNCFSLFHLNIRSLQRNFDNLLNLLTTVEHRFSVIGITETWLRQEEHNVGIDGYNFVPNYRHRKAGGGVGLYLADHLEFTLRIGYLNRLCNSAIG